MNKRYEKYFGRNISRIIYLIGIGLLGIGVFNCMFWHKYLGAIFCIVGVTLFFLTSHIQVSDKEIDELVKNAESAYAEEKIKGKVIGKETLNEADFSVFSGFIRDSGSVRFKAGTDQKIRTSRYYVTAISVKPNDCKIFTTVYDMLSGEKTVDTMISTKGVDSVEFSKEKIEFPHGNYKCMIKATRGESVEELTFYLPNDALAKKLTDKI